MPEEQVNPGVTPAPSTGDGPAKPEVIVAGAKEETPKGDLSPRQDLERKRIPGILAAFLPNRAVSGTTFRIIVAVQIALFLLVWINSPFQVLPTPMEVLGALRNLWLRQGLGPELFASYQLNVKALLLTAGISLGLAYLTVLPFFRPLAAAISKGRFLGMVGFTLVFTLMFGAPRLKLVMLVFGMTVFFITSMIAVVAAIPKADFDHARTLRMSEWRVVWEVVILGTVDKAFEVMRQNAAIGWMMLTTVEGVFRSEGGVGAMMVNRSKYINLLPEVFAIQIVILAFGLFQDYIIGVLRRLACPYADISLERRG